MKSKYLLTIPSVTCPRPCEPNWTWPWPSDVYVPLLPWHLHSNVKWETQGNVNTIQPLIFCPFSLQPQQPHPLSHSGQTPGSPLLCLTHLRSSRAETTVGLPSESIQNRLSFPLATTLVSACPSARAMAVTFQRCPQALTLSPALYSSCRSRGQLFSTGIITLPSAWSHTNLGFRHSGLKVKAPTEQRGYSLVPTSKYGLLTLCTPATLPLLSTPPMNTPGTHWLRGLHDWSSSCLKSSRLSPVSFLLRSLLLSEDFPLFRGHEI